MPKLGRRIAKWVGLIVLVGVAIVGYQAARFLSTEEVRFDDKALALLGGGGNTLLLDSDAGAMVVDTKFLFPASKLQKLVERVTNKPVKMIVNTHYHFDHTGGNPRYVGAEFVSAKSTPAHMLEKMAGTYGPGEAGARALPTTLVETGRRFPFGDDDVEVRYLGRGHTDGDVVVFLHKRRLLHTGDLFFNMMYPAMDAGAGASVREWGPALDQAIALDPQKVIPGHGPVCTALELKRFRAYIGALWDSALASAKAGKSLADAVSDFDDSRFGMKPMLGISSKAKNVEVAYDEAKAWLAAGH